MQLSQEAIVCLATVCRISWELRPLTTTTWCLYFYWFFSFYTFSLKIEIFEEFCLLARENIMLSHFAIVSGYWTAKVLMYGCLPFLSIYMLTDKLVVVIVNGHSPVRKDRTTYYNHETGESLEKIIFSSCLLTLTLRRWWEDLILAIGREDKIVLKWTLLL